MLFAAATTCGNLQAFERKPEEEPMKIASKVILVVAASALAVSCATTSVVRTWKKTGFSGPAYKKVLVAGVLREESTRRALEDAFAAQIASASQTGLTSYKDIPAIASLSKDSLKQVVQSSGADAVLVVRFVRSEDRTSIQDRYTHSPSGFGSSGLYDAWWGVGYYDPIQYHFEIYILESQLFDAQSAEMIWSCVTESLEPGDLQKEISRFAGVVLGKLRKDGVL
jgi:hypothetical protein